MAGGKRRPQETGRGATRQAGADQSGQSITHAASTLVAGMDRRREFPRPLDEKVYENLQHDADISC
jgi:hypothetical protein